MITKNLSRKEQMMGRKCLVSLVSAQTIPNVLLIKELGKMYPIDIYLFITTPRMKKDKKHSYIINACGLDEKKVKLVEVKEDDVKDTQEKLKTFFEEVGDDVEFIVNITGGTKLMAIATYDFFIGNKPHVYYIPFPQNTYIQILPERINNRFKINTRLTLKEYLESHGIEFKKGNPVGNQGITRSVLKFFIKDDNNAFFEVMRELRNNKKVRRKKGIYLEKISDVIKKLNLSPASIRDTLISLFEKAEYENSVIWEQLLRLRNENFLSKDIIEFLSGNWFEEYIYFELLSNISEEFLAVHLYIHKNGVPNDIDVALVHDNKFYYIECKTLLKAGEKGSILGETLHKMNSIKTKFGLSVYPILATLEEKERDFIKSQSDRFKDMRIKLLSRED
ncbi:DUF1887 family protein, partial [candidate division WOR-3 bacterium]|nr:DUF1887 family protein [candidate division WOR-3 bacterium]